MRYVGEQMIGTFLDNLKGQQIPITEKAILDAIQDYLSTVAGSSAALPTTQRLPANPSAATLRPKGRGQPVPQERANVQVVSKRGRGGKTAAPPGMRRKLGRACKESDEVIYNFPDTDDDSVSPQTHSVTTQVGLEEEVTEYMEAEEADPLHAAMFLGFLNAYRANIEQSKN